MALTRSTSRAIQRSPMRVPRWMSEISTSTVPSRSAGKP